MDILEFTNVLVDAALDKKGSDLLLLDMQEQVIFADYFLLVNAENDPQMRAIINNMIDEARSVKERPLNVESSPTGGWNLLDFGAVVVHVFSPEQREYYNLEELWQDARVVVRMQ